MRTLNAQQIVRDLALQFAVDRLAEVVAEQHIFGRDRRVGFEFEYPVSVGLLMTVQRARRPGDACLQRLGGGCRRRCGAHGVSGISRL